MKAFEKTEKLMIKLVVELLRQLILTHHSSYQWKYLWNDSGLKEDKQIIKRLQISMQDSVYLKFIKLCLE